MDSLYGPGPLAREVVGTGRPDVCFIDQRSSNKQDQGTVCVWCRPWQGVLQNKTIPSAVGQYVRH
jgi:hypothetical protein